MAAPLSFQLLLDTVLSSVGRLSCKEQLNIGSVEYIHPDGEHREPLHLFLLLHIALEIFWCYMQVCSSSGSELTSPIAACVLLPHCH